MRRCAWHAARSEQKELRTACLRLSASSAFGLLCRLLLHIRRADVVAAVAAHECVRAVVAQRAHHRLLARRRHAREDADLIAHAPRLGRGGGQRLEDAACRHQLVALRAQRHCALWREGHWQRGAAAAAAAAAAAERARPDKPVLSRRLREEQRLVALVRDADLARDVQRGQRRVAREHHGHVVRLLQSADHVRRVLTHGTAEGDEAGERELRLDPFARLLRIGADLPHGKRQLSARRRPSMIRRHPEKKLSRAERGPVESRRSTARSSVEMMATKEIRVRQQNMQGWPPPPVRTRLDTCKLQARATNYLEAARRPIQCDGAAL
eukprot:3560754-Pleurochrysis_carterae.AAC.2